ncbi:c-type cytochrome biogenesis protein CcsB [Ideonella livida]|uniref:C-type cytochrome biogenesis protein CcsB n=1 Tax=Ideonella livida TaxID=2707176 RepID=A0A7C9PG96_9BURK|nr:c-type cytochrome biogenesis protein CcsB [Ideonella livida]NDY91197.1 c-type cytochrome biogenesis protein CcsB [Ideonella livida]
MNTTTTTLEIGRAGWFSGRSPMDWAFALLIVLGAGYAFQRYGVAMDGYEKAILVGSVPSLIALGWFWAPLRGLSLGVGAATLAAIALYLRQSDGFGADLAAADQVFLLKYLLSSQSAILWMSTLFFMSTLFYWIGFFSGRGNDAVGLRLGSGLAWAAVFMALTGTMVRWFESHQIGPDIGHIPVSNLYEVFVLFCWMTALFYLYYEAQFKARALGGFVMLVVSAAVGFLLWYAVAREAHEIQPLVPALQSWWMKLHVPANFVGYGTFALSAMVALAYLLKAATPRSLWIGLVAVPGAVFVAVALAWLVAGEGAGNAAALAKAMRMVGGTTVFFALMIALRERINPRSPSLELMDDVMYKAIAVGFAFFTIATVLGAFWAAEAWGGYWSWDPKETWALIVWLNYAAWLHMRLMKGLRGVPAAWWSLVGLVVTTFAFLGVNMFLSGLHSYGEL